jgi:uncharacterized phage-associated protein
VIGMNSNKELVNYPCRDAIKLLRSGVSRMTQGREGENMAYDARSVANEVLRIAQGAGRTLTNMQLQKLVYIAHGYALAILHLPLIKQNVEAWRYGPVVADLYHALREYGAGKVTKPINILPNEELSETSLALLSEVVRAYGRFTGPQLSTMTHREGTPWKEVYDPNGWGNSIISDHLIEQHYLKLLHERAGINPA